MRFKIFKTFVRTLLLVAVCATLFTNQHANAQRAQKSQKPQGTPTPKTRKGADKQETKSSGATQPAARAQQQTATTLTVRWKGQPGVERYRLQIARDQGFSDIVFDQAVSGHLHAVSLPSGNYYWRVAPAVGETGTYSSSQLVEVMESPSVADEKVVTITKADSGWRTATGEVPSLVPVRLRAGRGLDLVGVNTDGTVYAIDGTNGVAIWTGRYNPTARRGEVSTAKGPLFAPLGLSAQDGKSNVVVAYEGGLRALRGETGTELWRATFPGRATGGMIADLDGDGKQEVVAVTADPATLVILSGESGRMISSARLDAPALGAPAFLDSAEGRGVVLGLEGGTVEVRGKGGELVRSVKLDTQITTAPLVVNTARALIVVIGVEQGLSALTASDLKPLGQINTGDDSPRGSMTVADLDGDGTSEVVMVTRGGRVALISTSDGKIRWVSEGAKDADSVALADLDGDGVLDVIAAAGSAFANGFSGVDGSLIWRVAEESGSRPATQTSGTWPRSLVIALSQTEGAFLVGGDPSRTGLQAVELPKGSVKTAER